MNSFVSKLCLITLFLAACSIQQDTCCKECLSSMNKDYFVSFRQSGYSDAKIYDIPQSSKQELGTDEGYDEQGFCGNFWKKFGGSCCDQQSLANRAEEMKMRFRDTGADIVKVLKDKQYTKIFEGISKISAFIEKNKDTLLKSEDYDMNSVNQLVTTLGEIGSMKNQFSEMARKALVSANTCFKSFMELRYSGLCIKCSGQAELFYSKETKAYRVKRAMCNNIIDSCIDLHSFNSKISFLISILIDLRMSLAETKDENAEYVNIEGPTEETLEILSQCAENKTQCLEDYGLVDFICSTYTFNAQNSAIEPNADSFNTAQASATEINEEKPIGSIQPKPKDVIRKSERSKDKIAEGKKAVQAKIAHKKALERKRKTDEKANRKKTWSPADKKEEKNRAYVKKSAEKMLEKRRMENKKKFMEKKMKAEEALKKSKETKQMLEQDSEGAKQKVQQEKAATQAQKEKMKLQIAEKTQEKVAKQAEVTRLTTLNEDCTPNNESSKCVTFRQTKESLNSEVETIGGTITNLSSTSETLQAQETKLEGEIENWAQTLEAKIAAEAEKYDAEMAKIRRAKETYKRGNVSIQTERKITHTKVMTVGSISDEEAKKYRDEDAAEEHYEESQKAMEEMKTGTAAFTQATIDAEKEMETAAQKAATDLNNATFQKDLAEKKRAHLTAQANKAKREREIKEKEKEMREYQAELIKNKKDIQTAHMEDINAQNTEITQEIESIKGEIAQNESNPDMKAQLEKKLEDIKMVQEALQSSKTEMTSRIDEYEAEKQLAEKEAERAENEGIQQEKQQMEFEAKEKEMEANMKVVEAEAEKMMKEAEKASIQQRLNSADEQGKIAIQEELEAKEKEINKLKEDTFQFAAEQGKYEMEAKKAEQERISAEKQAEVFEKEALKKEEELKSKGIAANITQVEAEQEHIAAKIAALKMELRKAEGDKLKMLKEEITFLEHVASELTAEAQDLSTTQEDVDSNIEAREGEIQAKKDAAKAAHKTQLAMIIESVDEEHGDVTREKGEAKEEMTAASAKLAELQKNASPTRPDMRVAEAMKNVEFYTKLTESFISHMDNLMAYKSKLQADAKKELPADYQLPERPIYQPPKPTAEGSNPDSGTGSSTGGNTSDSGDNDSDNGSATGTGGEQGTGGNTDSTNTGGDTGNDQGTGEDSDSTNTGENTGTTDPTTGGDKDTNGGTTDPTNGEDRDTTGGTNKPRLLFRLRKLIPRRENGLDSIDYTRILAEEESNDGFAKLVSDDVNGADPEDSKSGLTVSATELEQSDKDSQGTSPGTDTEFANKINIFAIIALVFMNFLF